MITSLRAAAHLVTRDEARRIAPTSPSCRARRGGRSSLPVRRARRLANGSARHVSDQATAAQMAGDGPFYQ
jgi:hypothetical protein